MALSLKATMQSFSNPPAAHCPAVAGPPRGAHTCIPMRAPALLPLPLQVIPARLPEFSLDHLTDLVEDLNKLG